MGSKVIEYILTIIIKAVLGLILKKVSPDVKAAMQKGMDAVNAQEKNKVDDTVIKILNPPGYRGSGIDAPLDGA